MFLASCAPRARLPLAAVEAVRPPAAAAQRAVSCCTAASPVPAKNRAASTTEETTLLREPPATPPISAGAFSGASNSARESPRQKNPVSPPPALEATRHCALALHLSYPPEKIRFDLTFHGPPFSFNKMSVQSPDGLHCSSHTRTHARLTWTRHCARENSSPRKLRRKFSFRRGKARCSQLEKKQMTILLF